jgi:hypothetical protein
VRTVFEGGPYTDPVNSIRRKVALALVAMAGACASAPISAGDDHLLPAGTWGGDHVALDVGASGAHFEFDCASGDIAKPLVIDDQGRLAMDGVFIQEHGGARRQGDEPNKQAARYTGQLRNKTLTFDITLSGAAEKVGSFIATLDATPVVRKCR